MNDDIFNKCREFLEKNILELDERKELIHVYLRLIELKSQYDLEVYRANIEKSAKKNEKKCYLNADLLNNKQLDD